MHASPGAYALLVGSGVSRAAKIPTGWEVVLDLARKVAALCAEDCEPDPAAWYKGKFGHDPDYSELLDGIGKTAAERQQLLRSYFEPSEDEREQGFKQPTQAHRAIAKLAAEGHCRVILTTNFDRLLERAIEDEGLAPVVISTPDAVEGALPLVHQRCCIVKLHGDYLDVRIKNAPHELAQYDERVNRLLDTILDQFGLIVCGWSAQWDTALRAALERCPTRRFTTYWCVQDKLTDEARQLAKLRDAQVISIQDADSFFGKLTDLLSALKDSARPHPASVEAATALVKRYLAGPRYRIQLEDLVTDETEAAHRQIEAYSQAVLKSPTANNHVEVIFQRYREITEILQAILIHGATFGAEEHNHLWIGTLQRISRRTDQAAGLTLVVGIRQYPTVVLLYASGLAALSRGHIGSVGRLLAEPKMRRDQRTVPLLLGVAPVEMHSVARTMPGRERDYAPMSEHLFEVLREPLRRYLPDDCDYEETFDRFEYLRALVHADLENKACSGVDVWWAPLGRFRQKSHSRIGSSIVTRMHKEIDQATEDWPLLKVGLFDGSLQRLKKVRDAFENLMAK